MKMLVRLRSTQAAMLLYSMEIYMPCANRYVEIVVEIANEIFIHVQM